MGITVNVATALDEALESPKCFCGNTKKMQQPFCGNCFYLLPHASRAFVYRCESDPDAYGAALKWLANHGEQQ